MAVGCGGDVGGGGISKPSKLVVAIAVGCGGDVGGGVISKPSKLVVAMAVGCGGDVGGGGICKLSKLVGEMVPVVQDVNLVIISVNLDSTVPGVVE